MAAKKSKKKITKPKMKPCPCPDHKGKKLPATPEYWHKGGNPDGFQGYCKQWRNRTQNAANKAARKAAKRVGKKAAKIATKTINTKTRLQVATEKILTRCNGCNKAKETNDQYWQSNGKGGIRQPCKSCIAKKRAEQKKRVDRTINSEYKEPTP